MMFIDSKMYGVFGFPVMGSKYLEYISRIRNTAMITIGK
jgi:hypothetical protein